MSKRGVIILPAYNEAERLANVIQGVKRVIENSNFDIDVVVINDGSTDSTEAIARDCEVKVLSHKKNKGLSMTFLTAINYVLDHDYEVMIFFDADDQFSPDDIDRVAEPVFNGKTDLSLGTRFSDGVPKDMPRAKVLGNRFLARFISRVTRQQLSDVACGFRAYSREALYVINISNKFTYTQEVILDLSYKGFAISSVPISVRYFTDRQSVISSNLWKYGWRVFNIVMRTIIDYRPLAFFGAAGAILFFSGLVLDIWMLGYWFTTGGFSPFKIVGFTGAFLNFLGLMTWIIGIVADLLNSVRRRQDDLLLLEKKRRYGR